MPAGLYRQFPLLVCPAPVADASLCPATTTAPPSSIRAIRCPVWRLSRHCEERSDEANPFFLPSGREMDCFASLAMTALKRLALAPAIPLFHGAIDPTV